MMNCIKNKVVRVLLLGAFVVMTFMWNSSTAKAYDNPYDGYKEEGYLPIDDSGLNTLVELYEDGSVFITASLVDDGEVPSSVTITVKNLYTEEIVKQITGFTSSQGITNTEIALNKGKYVISFTNDNAASELSDSELYLRYIYEIKYPEVEIPLPENVKELKVNNIVYNTDSYEGYNDINFSDALKEVVIPFKVNDKGGAVFALAPLTGNTDSLELTVYKDKACTAQIGESFVIDSSSDEDEFTTIPISKKGTYYAKFVIENDFKFGDYDTCKVQVNFIHSSDRTLSKQLTYYSAYQESNGKKITYKITVPKTGLVAIGVYPFDSDTNYDVSFRLLDKNKKQLVKEKYQTSLDSDKEANNKFYTLNKGTYYVQIDTNCSFYDIAYLVTSSKDQSGSQKSKAKAIKVNGSGVDGYFTNTEKKSKVDWFKFNITSSLYSEVYFEYYSDGNFKYELIDSNGKVVKSKVFKGEYVGDFSYSVYGALDKGTYYIKITKLDATGSMSYYINVKSN